MSVSEKIIIGKRKRKLKSKKLQTLEYDEKECVKEVTIGYVYFAFGKHHSNKCKIGSTTNMRAFKTDNPDIQIYKFLNISGPPNNHKNVEKLVQHCLAPYHYKLECFSLTRQIIDDFIRKYCGTTHNVTESIAITLIKKANEIKNAKITQHIRAIKNMHRNIAARQNDFQGNDWNQFQDALFAIRRYWRYKIYETDKHLRTLSKMYNDFKKYKLHARYPFIKEIDNSILPEITGLKQCLKDK
eukprot:887656_1